MHLLAVYLHDIDPYAIQLWPDAPLIRWYGLSYLAGFLAGYLLLRRVARVGRSTLTVQAAADLVVTVAVGTVLGGRLGYVLFYQRSLLWEIKDHFPWWGVLAINDGGMASHGGIIGMVLATLWFARRYRGPRNDAALGDLAGRVRGHPWGHLLDFVALGAGPGIFFGRLANFINGELYGRGPTDVPWAVKFPQEMHEWGSRQFDQLQEALAAQGLRLNVPAEHAVPWLIEEVQAGNERVKAALAPLLTPVHPSQLYAAVLEGLVLLLVVGWFWRKPRKPYLAAGVGVCTYAAMRFVDEFFRQPDAHIGLQGGLSRGQWLSLLTFLGGPLLIAVGLRSKLPPMGGWMRGERGEG